MPALVVVSLDDLQLSVISVPRNADIPHMVHKLDSMNSRTVNIRSSE